MSDFLIRLWFYGALFLAVIVVRLAARWLSDEMRPAVLGAVSLALLWKFLDLGDAWPWFIGYVIGVSILAKTIFTLRETPLAARFSAFGVATLAVTMLVFKYPIYTEYLLGAHAVLAGLGAVHWVGLSYLTFKAFDLLIYAGSRRAKKLHAIDAVSYLVFFPPFVSGPIHRFAPFAEDMAAPLPFVSVKDVRDAVIRISIGIIKILVLAPLARYNSVLHVFEVVPEPEAWRIVFGLYAYFLYLYLDFSGYCDVVIAAGRLLGVRIPENFRFPFIAANLQDFWNRWHISLSHWCRDHIFFPLMRQMALRVPWVPPLAASAASIFVTFLFVGAWHGDALNWVLYGLLHGGGLAIFVLYRKAAETLMPAFYDTLLASPIYRVFGTVLTVSYVSFGLLLTFDFEQAGRLLSFVF